MVAMTATTDMGARPNATPRNGYALCTRSGLDAITEHLGKLQPDQIDILRCNCPDAMLAAVGYPPLKPRYTGRAAAGRHGALCV
jgi:hypothetical protein